jgi:soluble lytic murein transglycosylase
VRVLAPVVLVLSLAAGALAGWRLGARDGVDRWGAAIDAAAREAGVEPALLRALVAVESGGDAAAVSRRGAVGLLQLMPGTGEEMAARLGVPWRGEATLRDPETNLRLGAAYLRRLLDRFDGQAAFAVAAYNAGPERVKAWRWRAADADATTAILREGFAETRRHVHRVLTTTYRTESDSFR